MPLSDTCMLSSSVPTTTGPLPLYQDRPVYYPARRNSNPSSSSSSSSSSCSWKCARSICAMSSASEAYSPPSPPSVSPITAHRTQRTISPGVYISKGEGHSVRHSWIIDGRLVEFPFAATNSRDTCGHKTAGSSQAICPPRDFPPVARPLPTGSVGGGRSV